MHKGHEATIAGLTVYLFGLCTEATHLQDSLKLQVIFQQTDIVSICHLNQNLQAKLIKHLF